MKVDPTFEIATLTALSAKRNLLKTKNDIIADLSKNSIGWIDAYGKCITPGLMPKSK
nr:hypothetical protein [Mycoplasmopsis bovis]